MSAIIFYEKPGCGGNAKQRAWLEAAGHVLEVRNLLTWHWTRESLLGWLSPLPVAQWFNRAAPAVRDGEVVPESLDAEQAIELMLAMPLLIRRPLIELADGYRLVGFNEDVLRSHLEQADSGPAPGEACARSDMSGTSA
jgi:nitrogenase-associated protein